MKNWQSDFLANNRIVRFFHEQRPKCVGGEADFTLCRYALTGEQRLLRTEGGLLARLGFLLPEFLSGLREAAEGWSILPQQREKSLEYLHSLTKAEAVVSLDFDMVLASHGGRVWLSVSAMRRELEIGPVLELCFFSLESERVPLDQLVKENVTDPLTGALNRASCEDIVNILAADTEPHVFFMIDIDGFKSVNDTCGHETGDQVLIDVYRSLKEVLGEDAALCRVGGDEFFIAAGDSGTYVDNLARRICAVVRRSLPSGLSISASLGVAISPRDGTDFQTLYQKADVAMYMAKRMGGDRWVAYKPDQRMETDVHPNSRLLPVTNTSSALQYNGSFLYSAASVPFADADETRPFWRLLLEKGIADEQDAEDICVRILRLAESGEPGVESREYLFRMGGFRRAFLVTFLCVVPGTVQLLLTDMNNNVLQMERLRRMAEYDKLTGLLNNIPFCTRIDTFFRQHPGAAAAGEYAVIYLDVVRFKAVNDLYGQSEGNRLLVNIADHLSRAAGTEGFAGRIGSDRFALFLHAAGEALETQVSAILSAVTAFPLPMEITCNAGIYVIADDSLTGDAMVDRACMALDSIKGHYDRRYGYYTEGMRWSMLNEQALAGSMSAALAENQFLVHYQPQYNHATGMLVGAEALVRWLNPGIGLISPNDFIPLFEKNGFITRLDLYVFEQVCRFHRRCLNAGISPVPISVNITRYDILQPDFPERLESLRTKYDVPARLIRVEITESAIMGSSEYVNSVVKRLHASGYVVEMDDFGSGYSSLNVLKDIDLDVIKLDMRFLSKTNQSGRGGTILSSVVRMAKWMNLPVIAEGVETAAQADFLRSIGCEYIQGYLYAKPMPEQEYEALLSGSKTDRLRRPELTSEVNLSRFWDPASLETLVFSKLVGGAAIVDYHRRRLTVLRVNRKYVHELGMSQSEEDFLSGDPMRYFSEDGKNAYFRALEKAAETGEEQECETWRHYDTPGCKDEDICLRSTIHLISTSEIGSLFYVTVRNVTAEKLRYDALLSGERRFKAASEQANIYYWEYDIRNREMRPCFRCMRDLGFPPLVQNYPEPAIDAGVIPADYAELYRNWHRQIEAGIPSLEAVIPLTVGRVPFHVRYTTEFDESGRPVKAYGSATLVVDGCPEAGENSEKCENFS